MVSVRCIDVRVSVMFHFMFVHYTVLIVFCLFVILIYFPFWFKERDLVFDCSSSCSLLFYYF